ncbi:proline iminopeptidase-family hydrolase [Tropicimonas sp. IMCC6043]|uniref:proline iminopeptidase-family hydrolase n=1 Tax=Tropicimonas sp. IMCC6043 TaxID=2510645 RepID=UPI00101DAD9F|nr:proline iminopeptidase-family hydrolase [Tropicimonas sp. IMCC6043]RYH07597.1 alpha/beta fold hydrolase [Tropicimonas sp. IMCC6043]
MSYDGHIILGNGYKLWYRIAGQGSGAPLLLLHGGPGAGHDYLEPLEALSADRPVVFFDQLGCGRSDQPDDPTLWTVERFCDEVDEVRDALGLAECHILGQSWGGWLAIEWLLRRPKGVKSAVLASTSSSTRQFVTEAQRLIGQMSEAEREALRIHGAAGAYDHPDYLSAMETFYRLHVCRLPDWPDCLNRTVANLDGNQVYMTMNGPNEFTVIGNLKDWDRTDRLHEIDKPVLITVGRHDEITPVCSETMHQRLPESRVVIFEDSAHCAHIEEPERYCAVVAEFLREHD